MNNTNNKNNTKWMFFIKFLFLVLFSTAQFVHAQNVSAPPVVTPASTSTRVVTFEYHPTTGVLLKEISEPDDTQFRLEAEYTYDRFGNRTKVTTSSPVAGIASIPTRTTQTNHDANGRFPIINVNTEGHTETLTFDPKLDVLIAKTGSNGITVNWEYDNFGRQKSEKRLDGNSTEISYHYCSGVAGGTVACPSYAKYMTWVRNLDTSGVIFGPQKKTYFNQDNKEIKLEVISADGATIINTITEYDNFGRVSRVSKPYKHGETLLWTNYYYDVLNRVTRTVLPNNSQLIMTYNGLATETINPLNQKRIEIEYWR